MLVCNGIVGVCLLFGGLRHRQQGFQIRGASAPLAELTSLSELSLVMPNYISVTLGPTLSASQLAFAGVSSLVLYGVLVFVQTVRHRDYFLADAAGDENAHAAPPSARVALTSSVWMMVCLVAAVLLAKVLSPIVERAVLEAGAPSPWSAS